MSGPLTCIRCLRPLTGVTPGGLCETCRRAGPTPPPADPVAEPTPFASTRPAPADPAALTPTADGRPPDPPAPLPLVPGYELLDLLGAGGMGVVYKAREIDPDRVVAVKLIRAVTDPSVRERFRVEVRSLARLDHPNIVRVHSVNLGGREPYFTMEYVDGPGLDKRLTTNGPLPPGEAARITEAVARAVHAAHTAGVIHRDLKPGNVLVAADGTPKVTDFGLAKRVDGDDGLTVSDAILGTPGFMAPEQAGRRNAEVGPRTDVYGLGATLYALLTGHPPFRGRDPIETAEQVRRRPPTPPRDLRPEVPRELEGIVLRCLEKDPAARYPSAEALADDLARWIRGERPEAPPLTRLRRAWRAVRRRGKAIAVGAIGVALVVGAAVIAAAAGPRPPGPPPGPPPAPDPLAEIQRELAAGRPVVLVGPTGEPRWQRWRLSRAELGESPVPESDGTRACSFEAIHLSLLDLIPDPGIPRYRVSAELRHLAGKGPAPGAQTGPDVVGLYFGADEIPAAGGCRAHSLFAVTFQDYRPLRPAVGPALAEPRARFDATLVVQRPDRLPGQHTAAVASVPFEPVERRPGKWRKVVADVTPDSLLVRWRTDAGELEPFILPGPWPRQWTGEQARELYARLQPLLDDALRQPGLTVRPWNPRLAVGVLAEGSAVAFRNVVIEPLTAP